MKSQLLRFKRICTTEGDRVDVVKILFGALRRRGLLQAIPEGHGKGGGSSAGMGAAPCNKKE